MIDTSLKIYVAGHNGMVGSAIHRILISKGYHNIVVRTSSELDLRRQTDVEAFFESERPDIVYLSAAKVGGIIANNTYKFDFIYDNLAIAMNVIKSAHRFGVKKLLNLGSSCIYPKYAEQPMSESALLTGPLEPTNEPYAIAKIAAIKLCRYCNEQYSTNFLSAMPTNLYGMNDNFNLETSHVLPALIRKMILAEALRTNRMDWIIQDCQKRPLGFGIDQKINTNDFNSIKQALSFHGITADGVTLWGSGNVRREFLHADDVANACVFLMENYNATDIGEFVNIGMGIDLSIRELAEIVRKTVKFEGELHFDSTKPDGTPRKLLDISRMEKLGWKATISLEKGIENIVHNYLQE
ncbi:MAG: GDP-L-fucose synthase [Bacteroidetes bacterium]|nr:GDP-L-fucose synthase [Bacteroidota bacterium]